MTVRYARQELVKRTQGGKKTGSAMKRMMIGQSATYLKSKISIFSFHGMIYLEIVKYCQCKDRTPFPGTDSRCLQYQPISGKNILRYWLILKGLKYDQNVVHLNLALSIAVSNGLYVAADFAYKVKYLCMGVSIGIMYFYLATLFWILVESFHLYMLIVRRAKDTNMTMFYMIIGWVAPSIIVALTAALQRQYFLKEAFCWLKYDNWVIWTLVGPSLFIILLSVILLSLSLVSSFKLERSLAGVLKFQRVTKFVFALIPLIGLCWSAALLAVNEQDKEYYQYILTGINGAIALLGLLSFCLLSSSDKGAMTGTRSMSSMGKDNKGNDTSTLSLSVITEPAFHSKTNF